MENELAQLRQRTNIIGIVASLIKEQRILDALWVFETLKHIPLNFRTYIVGDGKERENLLRCRDGWHLSPNVCFLGKRKDTLQLLPQFHILLHLGGEKADCLSVRDAVKLGVPVIATDTQKIRKLTQEYEKCILIPDCGEDFRLRRRLFAKKTFRFFKPLDSVPHEQR